jgi:type I restriction enzyme S subunit
MGAVEGWIDIKIRDLFSSSTPGDWGKDGNQEDGVPVLRSTNFCNNGSIDYSDIAYREVDETRLKKRRVDKGTILIEKSGGSPSQAAGRVVYCDREFNGTASNFIEVVKVKDAFSSRYVAFLLYYLYQIGVVLKYQQQTTGIINFKLNEYSEEMVNCPASKPEQTKIAEILSTVDRAIEQTEALIAKQQRIKTGLMQDLLTRGIDEYGNLRSEQTHKFKDSPLGRIPEEWALSQIGSAVSLQRGHDITESELLDGPYPVVSSSGVIGYHVECTSKGPNVVVGRKGTIGKVHYMKHDFWAHDTALYVTNFGGNNERYIFYLFNYLDLARYGTKSGSPSLNRNDVHPLWIGLPLPDEQKKITSILNKCDQGLDTLGRGFEKLRAVKTALMQGLLTGKKRVTALIDYAENEIL